MRADSATPPPPTAYSYVVASEPSGATVSVNGTPQGSTPITLQLPPGSYVLETSAPSYQTDFRSLVLNETSPTGETIHLKPATAAVLIQSTPAQATVLKDGVQVGLTPLLIPELPFGMYRIEIQRTGYKPHVAELHVASTSPQKLTASLVSSSAALQITSDPVAATVRLNGITRGSTPLTLDAIEEGQVTIEIASEGYESFKEQITLAAGETFTLHTPLSPIPSTLSIISIPPHARVYVNNEFQGESPLTLEKLPGGSYRIRIEKQNFEPMARDVQLARNTRVVEEFKLTPNVGSLLFTTTPPHVEISIQGTRYGKTIPSSTESDTVSEKCLLSNIPAGQQTLVFSRKGYIDVKKTIDIKKGETHNLELIKLERLFIPNVEVKTKTATYQGVYVSKNDEFYRLETKPGLTMSIPMGDIVTIRFIREENAALDNTPSP